MVSHALDKTLGIELLERALVKIEERIKSQGGGLTVKMKPRAVSEHDDMELAQLMAKVERENAEVSGDDDFEEGIGGAAADEI